MCLNLTCICTPNDVVLPCHAIVIKIWEVQVICLFDSVMFKQNVCKIPDTHSCVYKALRDYNSQRTFETGPGGALCHMTPGGPVGCVTWGKHPPPLPGPWHLLQHQHHHGQPQQHQHLHPQAHQHASMQVRGGGDLDYLSPLYDKYRHGTQKWDTGMNSCDPVYQTCE